MCSPNLYQPYAASHACVCVSAYSGVRQQRCPQHFHKVTFRRQSDTEDREGCDSFNRCLSPACGKHQPAVQELYISVHGSNVGKLYIHKSGVQAYYWIHFHIFICYFLTMENLIILALCLQPSIILLDFNLLALSDRLTNPIGVWLKMLYKSTSQEERADFSYGFMFVATQGDLPREK